MYYYNSIERHFQIFLVFVICLYSSQLISQESLRIVRAEQGDGIYAILRKQGLNPSAYIDEFLRLNKDRVRNGNQLVVGGEYIIPAATGSGPKKTAEASTKEVAEETVKEVKKAKTEVVAESKTKKAGKVDTKSANNYPIFGTDFANVEAKSSQLEGTVYYLISGHGGPDPGAIENYKGTTIAEDEYAYDVTLRLARELLAYGAKVYVIVRDENDGIRDERVLEVDRDEVVYPDKEIPLDQVERLKQRVDVVNDLYLKNRGKYQRLLVTHVDSRSRNQNIDVFFYYHENSKNGKRLAESMHTTFKKKYNKYQPYRDYSGTFTDKSSLYMVKNTLPAMVFIELGNIKNGRDKRRILDPDNRQALAKWISEGIILDFDTR